MRFGWCFGLGKLHAIRQSREGEVAWGEARLICYLDGKSELRGDSERDRLAAQE